MNRQRDIERVLDAWFVDGPSVMPDRLFDAVLDRVERVPQRRLARLHLRLTEMNPRIRLYSLAAAGLIVAVVGLYLLNRANTNPDVGASPSPAATPSVAATPSASASGSPAALVGLWIGGPRALPGLDADAGRVITFEANGEFVLAQSANGGGNRLISTVASTGGDGITFTSEAADADCDAGATGAYTWSVSGDGQTLSLAPDGTDGCAVRATTIQGDWELVDCPTPEDNCLGTIAAGTHASHFFDHMVMPGEPWTPRYGAVTYTVPDGWVNVEDWPDFFRVAPVGGEDETFIQLVNDIVLSSRDDPCSGEADSNAASTPSAIAEAIASSPGLEVSTPEPVTVGGLSGVRFDLALDPEWTTACSYSEGRPHQELFTDRPLSEGFSAGIEHTERNRVYLLEPEEGRTSLIVIWAADAMFDAFVEDAAVVVESMTFTP